MFNMEAPAIPYALKRRVQTRVNAYLRIVSALWPLYTIPPITITYDLSGTSAGLAYCHLYQINFSPVLLLENVDEFINTIIGHEVAHIVSAHIFGQNIADHGSEWSTVMEAFNIPSARCHNLDTTNARRRITRWKHKCKCPGKVHDVSSRLNRAIMTQTTPNVVCLLCASKLIPVKVPSMVKGLPKMLQHETKVEKAKWVINKYKGKTRAKLIALLMDMAGLTKAGATTYYYNLTKNVD